MVKRLIQRKIAPKELKNETEGKHKFFRIKYSQIDDIIPVTREYQRKYNVERILDNPLTRDVTLFVLEVTDDV